MQEVLKLAIRDRFPHLAAPILMELFTLEAHLMASFFIWNFSPPTNASKLS